MGTRASGPVAFGGGALRRRHAEEEPCPISTRCAFSRSGCAGCSAWTIHNANHLRDSAGRAEGRRPPGELRVDDGDHGGALFPCARAERQGRGEAPCRAGAPRRSIICSATRAATQLEAFRGVRRRAILSEPDQGPDPGRLLDRLGRPRRRRHRLRQPGPGLSARPRHDAAATEAGRMVALMGDAELDEGNIYECLIEACKHDIRNCWWIVDYNRQSLDATTAERMFQPLRRDFRELRLAGRHAEIRQADARRPSPSRAARRCSDWIDDCPNADYAGIDLSRRRGLARAAAQGGARAEARPRRARRRGAAALMTNLAGHDMAAWSRRSTARRTTSRPCSSPTRSRASACPSPATRTIMPG